ncbi:beta-ketoacyl-[acyl-carrier-protein] synthase family protein [Mucilaginibacter sp.]
MSELNKKEVFVVADNILSPLGKTTAENFAKLKESISSVNQHHNTNISPLPFFASLFEKDEQFVKAGEHNYTKFEQLLIASIADALNGSGVDVRDKKTVLIISSTKGNISLLENQPMSEELKDRISLSTSADLVAAHFGFQNKPIVVSNACISGVLGVITAKRLLGTGQYEHAVVAGADVISKFILSGFQSFQALSPARCRPFDKSHDGLNLGEGAGTVILSTNEKHAQNIKLKGGSVSNDANHISGPSRTGQELAGAVKNALQDAELSIAQIDFISAHGTATVYNDEMEANAIAISGLQKTPLNSLKGYYGHTLGAAGLIESIISIQCVKQGLLIPTIGFKEPASEDKVTVCAEPTRIKAVNFLKTASGFGGCNAAVVFGK